MKNIARALVCLMVIASLQIAGLAQTTGYSIVDNNQDATQRNQQLYRINTSNGETNYIGDLVIGGQRVQREYEGLASIGATLYGISEFGDLTGGGVLCNTGDNPITGLSTDLRTFRVGPQQTVPTPATPSPAPVALPSGLNTVVGPQIGETCMAFGSESGMGYNATDGYLYSVSSDDLIANTLVRTQVNKISPSTGLNVASCNVVGAGAGADPFPYLDGASFVGANMFGADARFTNNPVQTAGVRDNGGLYQIDISSLAPFSVSNLGPASGPQVVGQNPTTNLTCSATLVKYLFDTDLNFDTGLATRGATLVILRENGGLFTTNTLPGGAVSPQINLRTTGATSGAGGGAAGQRIEGCRGAITGVANEFEPAAPTVGGCRDFEGLDIPAPALN